jgi:hypothetical protein
VNCPKCGAVIAERSMRVEMARLMRARKTCEHRLTPEQAREFGRLGALKRWGKENHAK